MKCDDIEKIHEAGLITAEQRERIIATFVFCLLQVQVGVQERSRFLVNLGVAFLTLDIIATYIGLFGSMAFTGLTFILSGVFLILFAVVLEKKRSTLMKQIKSPPDGLRPEAAQI